MLQRVILFVTVLAASCALATGPAFGWSNGGDGGNGYATHDWILQHAITLAGAKASWVNVGVALRASDDPDKGPNKTSLAYHNYKGTIRAVGAPTAVASEYYQVVKYYRLHDYTTASMHLGRMSHYYADICQPYHTDVRGSGERNPRHVPYEEAMSVKQRHYSSCASWVHPRARATAGNVFAETIAAALYARARYETVDSSFKANHAIVGAGKTDTIQVLNRAINDLADITSGVASGTGLAKPPAEMRQALLTHDWQHSSSDGAIGTEVYCYDASGNPMVSVQVRFTWALPTGTRSLLAFTDANGRASGWQTPASRVTVPVTVSVSSYASGKYARASRQWVP